MVEDRNQHLNENEEELWTPESNSEAFQLKNSKREVKQDTDQEFEISSNIENPFIPDIPFQIPDFLKDTQSDEQISSLKEEKRLVKEEKEIYKRECRKLKREKGRNPRFGLILLIGVTCAALGSALTIGTIIIADKCFGHNFFKKSSEAVSLIKTEDCSLISSYEIRKVNSEIVN